MNANTPIKSIPILIPLFFVFFVFLFEVAIRDIHKKTLPSRSRVQYTLKKNLF